MILNNKILIEANFKVLFIHKPSLGSHEIPHKSLARSVPPFGRLLDTNIQTNKFSICLSIYLKILSFKYQLPYDCESKLRVFAVETGKEFGIFDLRLNEENGDIFLITV